jgi:hypothetical protein
MENFPLVMFKNGYPLYICPWCKSYGIYNDEDRRVYGYCFYIVGRCLKCSENIYPCTCNVVYPKSICRKHADTFQIKVNTTWGIYDVLAPNNDQLMEKQKSNILRLCKFMRNVDHIGQVRIVTNAGNKWCKQTPIDDLIKSYVSNVFKNVYPITTPIRYALTIYHLPLEIIMFVFQLIVKSINSDDLEGIITL